MLREAALNMAISLRRYMSRHGACQYETIAYGRPMIAISSCFTAPLWRNRACVIRYRRRLAPPLFGFLGVAPHRVGFGKRSPISRCWPSVSTTASELASAASNTAIASWMFMAGCSTTSAIMQDADEAARRVDIGRVRVGDQRQPDIAAGAVDPPPPGVFDPSGNLSRNSSIGVPALTVATSGRIEAPLP